MNTEALLEKMATMDRVRPEPQGPHLSREILLHLKHGGEIEDVLGRHLVSCDVCLDHLVDVGVELPRLGNASIKRILDETKPKKAPFWARGWVVAAVTAAAAILLVVSLPEQRQAGVPVFTMEVAGSVATSRGSTPDTTPKAWGADSEVRFLLAPLQHEGGAASLPDFATYVGRPGQQLQLVAEAPMLDTDPSTGLVEIIFPASTLFNKGAGPYRLGVLILPADTDAPPALEGDSPELPDGARLMAAEARFTP